MDEYTIPSQGFNYVYKEYEVNEGPMKELARYELVGNNKLYLVQATYAKSLPPNKYYIVAKNLRLAKTKFKNIFSWLNVIHSVEVVEGDDLQWVLTHPKNVCLR